MHEKLFVAKKQRFFKTLSNFYFFQLIVFIYIFMSIRVSP